jgi:hypothetical protein
METWWLPALYQFFSLLLLSHRFILYTVKKGNKIFRMYKEIQNGALTKSYMTNGLLIYGEIFTHFLIY